MKELTQAGNIFPIPQSATIMERIIYVKCSKISYNSINMEAKITSEFRSRNKIIKEIFTSVGRCLIQHYMFNLVLNTQVSKILSCMDLIN